MEILKQNLQAAYYHLIKLADEAYMNSRNPIVKDVFGDGWIEKSKAYQYAASLIFRVASISNAFLDESKTMLQKDITEWVNQECEIDEQLNKEEQP